MYRLVQKPEEGPSWRREVFAVPVSDSKFDGRRPFKDSDIEQRGLRAQQVCSPRSYERGWTLKIDRRPSS